MRVPDPNAHRYDENGRVLIAPAGELDISTVHSLRAALARDLHDGVRIIDLTRSGFLLGDRPAPAFPAVLGGVL
ncbi:hypothetical protein ABZY44_07685 [Streptomyces sp. NPDC006544]|uniref:hypothetical protein n=1 Tax=Streptomyces sp. NPDC006544 TaxID=3154583 RepID=UPI0033B6FBBA